MGIDQADLGYVRTDTCLITGIILSATFLATSEWSGYRTLYGIMSLTTALLDKGQSQWAKHFSLRYSGYLLLVTALLHLTERIYWHIVQKRPFLAIPTEPANV